MKALADMGFKQGVLAPQERPDGRAPPSFSGSDADVIQRAAKEAMPLLVATCSASSMWVANAATVSPSADTADGRVHFTAANLIANTTAASSTRPPVACWPRCSTTSNASPTTRRCLPWRSSVTRAANHTRFCRAYGEAGVEFFVWPQCIRQPLPGTAEIPRPADPEASQAVARLHGLHEDGVVYAQQNPAVIDQGVFHNDVIAVGNGEVLFYHEDAFLETDTVLGQLRAKLASKGGASRPSACRAGSGGRGCSAFLPVQQPIAQP